MSRIFGQNLKNHRYYLVFRILIAVFFTVTFAELIANDKPLIVKFDNKYYFPIIKNVPEKIFIKNNHLLTNADFHDSAVINAINNNGWLIFPIIPFSYQTINFSIDNKLPSPPTRINILGTDDNGRDLLARLIYGMRTSLYFGIILGFISLSIAIFFGSIQGYFGGWIDLILQRFSEIWSSLPIMFLLLILSTIIEPNFLYLLLIISLFSWMGIANYIRAEFLRVRNLNFIKAAKVVGCSNFDIIFHHILPNIIPIIISTMPFLIAGAISSLTALDFLGFGLSVNSASLGELLNQGKNNLTSYWLGITGFCAITFIITALVLIGEMFRDLANNNINNSK
jgi:microcin C transport system permease protein